MFHSLLPNRRLPLYAGLAIGGTAALFMLSSSNLKAETPEPALDPKQFLPLPIVSSRYISKDTKEFILALPEGHVIGGKTAFMVMFRWPREDGKDVIRPYTPVSSPETVGETKFVIKAYPHGKMTQHLHGLKVGDKIDVKGPIQKFLLERNQFNKICLIAGGTGITPMYQILQKIADDPKDTTRVQLFYGSNTPEDILIKDQIDALVQRKPDQLQVTYFATEAPNGFDGEKGYVTKEYLDRYLFKPSEKNVKVFLCGPPPLYKAISGPKKSPTDQGELTGALAELGFDKDQVFKF